MLGEEVEGLRARGVGGFLVVGAALVAVESVANAHEHVARDLRPRGLDLFNVGHGDRVIGLAEEQNGRNLRLLVAGRRDAAAVIADRRAQSGEIAGGQEGQRAAEAIADDADLAAFRRLGDGRGDVGHEILVLALAAQGGAGLHVGLLVARLVVLLHAIVDRRRDGDVAMRGVEIGGGADVMVDAEDFLNDDDAALGRAGRSGQIGADLDAVPGGQFDMLSHDVSPYCVSVNRWRSSARRAIKSIPASRASGLCGQARLCRVAGAAALSPSPRAERAGRRRLRCARGRA